MVRGGGSLLAHRETGRSWNLSCRSVECSPTKKAYSARSQSRPNCGSLARTLAGDFPELGDIWLRHSPPQRAESRPRQTRGSQRLSRGICGSWRSPRSSPSPDFGARALYFRNIPLTHEDIHKCAWEKSRSGDS
jgi:hypothetical protein